MDLNLPQTVFTSVSRYVILSTVVKIKDTFVTSSRRIFDILQISAGHVRFPPQGRGKDSRLMIIPTTIDTDPSMYE